MRPQNLSVTLFMTVKKRAMLKATGNSVLIFRTKKIKNKINKCMNLHALSWFNLHSNICTFCTVYSYINFIKLLADKGPVSAPGPTKGI